VLLGTILSNPRLDGAPVTGYLPTRSRLEPIYALNRLEGSLAPDYENIEKQEVRMGW